MKRILHCTLMLMLLVTFGCDLLPGSGTTEPPQNSNSQSTQQPENKISFTDAETHVREALKRFDTGRTSPSANVKSVKEKIKNATDELGQDENDIAERCANCREDTKTRAAAVLEVLNGISNKLGTETRFAKLTDDVKNDIATDLDNAANELKALSIAKTKTVEAPTPSPSPVQSETNQKGETKKTDTDDEGWTGILVLALKIVAGLLALVVIATLISYLWKRAWKTVEFNLGRMVTAHVAAAREVQPDYATKLSSLSSTQAEMSSRLTELDAEVRSLARLVRESLATRRTDRNPSYGGGDGRGFNYQSYVEDTSPKDEPEFPVSAVDYLGKMDRFANVVRPDFQNGILVNAPDGDGELVLIRDSRDDTQPLFVVPRATQFQTKQDFYTYYQKYYDCVRPSAGDVWIIGPAVVEKVAGGWQLREKGMLEIR